jgi:hypothetical protein
MLSIYKPPHEQSISVMGADITGRYGLVSSWNRDGPFNQSLQVIDVSDSLSPTLLADYPMNPTQVVVQGSFAFVAEIISGSDSMKLDVIDISQLPQIQVLSEINLPGNIHDVAFDGRYAYVADGQAGLRVVDLSDPSNPLEVFAYDTPGNAVAVAQEGEWVYLADQDGGLLVFRKVRNFVYMPVVNVTGAQ